MARVFTDDLYDLPRVNPLDWTLWERIDQVVASQLSEKPTLPIYYATDRRGQYDAESLAELRAEVERQEDEPDTIRLTVSVGGPADLFINVYASTTIPPGGRIQSQDEVLTKGLAARVRDIFASLASAEPEPHEETDEEVAERMALEYAENPPRYVNVVTGVERAPSRWERRRRRLARILNHPWVIGVGAILIAAAILAIIAALTR